MQGNLGADGMEIWKENQPDELHATLPGNEERAANLHL